LASRRRKLLLGVGLGCATLLILGISGCIGFAVWISRPGELLEPERLLAGDALAYAEWTLRAEDDGTREFIEALFEKTRRVAHDRPSWMPNWLAATIAGRQQRNERQIRQVLPMVAAWTLRPGADRGTDGHLWMFSMENLGNRLTLADWFLGLLMGRNPGAEVVAYRDEKLFRVRDGDSDVTFFLRGTDLFVATELDQARYAVDRLADVTSGDVTGGDGAGRLGALYASLPAAASLRGVILNDEGRLMRIWDAISRDDADLGSAEQWDAIRSVTVHGGLAANRSFTARLEFLCRDETWAREHAKPLVARLRSGLRFGHMKYETDVMTEGDRIRIDFRVPDVPAQLDSF